MRRDDLFLKVLGVVVPIFAGILCGAWIHRPPELKRAPVKIPRTSMYDPRPESVEIPTHLTVGGAEVDAASPTTAIRPETTGSA